MMSGTAAQIAGVLDGIARDVLTQLGDISQEDLNRSLALPESSSLFALATHLVGAGEFWVLVLVGQRDIPRDRPTEFRSTGQLKDLRDRYERWIQGVHEVLDTLPDERLGDLARPPAGYHSTTTRETGNIYDALLHALEHCALHQGHIQLTRQLLGYAPPEED